MVDSVRVRAGVQTEQEGVVWAEYIRELSEEVCGLVTGKVANARPQREYGLGLPFLLGLFQPSQSVVVRAE